MIKILDFYSPCCGPCQQLTPIIDELARLYQGKIKIQKINIEENTDLTEKYQIEAVPTLIFLKNEQEAKRLVGLKTKKELIKEIEKFL